MGAVFFLGYVLLVMALSGLAGFWVFLANRISRLARDRGYPQKRYFYLSLMVPFIMVPLISYLPIRPGEKMSGQALRSLRRREWLRVAAACLAVLLAATIVTAALFFTDPVAG